VNDTSAIWGNDSCPYKMQAPNNCVTAGLHPAP
jgi:hypothetical protein